MTIHRPEAGSPAATTSRRHPVGSATPAEKRRAPGTLRAQVARHGLRTYTLVAYAVSWTLLIGGYLATHNGVLDIDGTPVGLLVQVAAAGPLIAALVVVSITRGRSGLASFGRSLIQWRVSPRWYALAFLGIPLIMVAAMEALYPAQIAPALADNWAALLTQLPLMILALALVTGLAEEPGWRGYAQPEANHRYQPLTAALVVSTIWALWHLPNALFSGGLTETLLHLLATTVNGFVLAWAYNATGGSVFIVMLLHGAQNGTAGLVDGLFEGTTHPLTASEYYLVSAVVFGVIMLVVAVRTRGRLGLPPTANHA